MDKINSFEDACKALDVVPSTINLEGIPKKYQDAVRAHYQLIIIAEALNEGWVPDWNDGDQPKYFPWFDMEGGFRFGDVLPLSELRCRLPPLLQK